MNIKHIVLPSVALGAAAALLLPAQTQAYSTIGGSLSTSQRDVRCFNNFTVASANGNTLVDANFPGRIGAPMAVWKSVVEWGAVLHGTGNGDPHQPGGLGSGGANMDAAWAGQASDSGGTNDNVMSEIAGCNGGVLAFTETPISDGWRIFFYQCWAWDDGPGANIGGNIDIQGVACHEYGHSLGLGHSTAAGGPTMAAGISGSGVSARSISSDDIAGIQFIYGVAAATKPRITGVSVAPGSVTITGTNFTATGNQVWFTRSANSAGNISNPLIVATPTSQNTTSITVNTPAAAGSGDVLIKTSGTGNTSLSNAWPVDLTGATCPTPTNFCLTSPNTYDAIGAIMSSSGSTSVGLNNFQLLTFSVPPLKTCVYFYGLDQTALLPMGNGWRCIGSPFFRLPFTTSNDFGDVMFNVNLNTLPPGGQISSGQSWGFQCFYRNPEAGGAFFNVSDGLSTIWCP